MTFIHPDFLLQSVAAQRLYHEFAAEQPILDYHCHLSPHEIAEDRRFDTMTQIWLGGDHYKWRAMRAAGIDERFITGDATDREKFQAWIDVFPQTLRHPLFHWSMLELAKPFGITELFPTRANAQELWDRCNGLLSTPEFSARNIMKRMNVELVCTTDDPVDALDAHHRLGNDFANGTFSVRVLPTFRPDRALPIQSTDEAGVTAYNSWLHRLEIATEREIRSFDDLLSALENRHDFFHASGCRLADHGFERFDFAEPSGCEGESLASAFASLRAGRILPPEQLRNLSSAILLHLGRLHAEKDWTMQLHLGAIRNNSTRIFQTLGPDAGCDSIADGDYARPLSRFLDRLDRDHALPKTILYNLNPASNAMLAAMIANFNREIPGKMQYGAGWWFLDQRDGILHQLETVSTMGLLSRFVGMLTDSRSFLSYTRHEYFRRILCNLLGDEMEQGLLPNDFDWIGNMVRDICYRNAVNYFEFSTKK